MSIQIQGQVPPQIRDTILTQEALAFVGKLHVAFNKTRLELLQKRAEQTKQLPNFLPETQSIREDKSWTGPPLAPGLVNRQVEITGPTDRKMVINALNSGVNTFMADFEDSLSPTWDNLISGQQNLYDAVRGRISYKDPRSGKDYKLKDSDITKLTTLIVRPRGWHLNEAHVLVNGEQTSGSLFDFGLYFFHNAKKLIELGRGPYFYLPKMQHHLEAKLWNDVFNAAQDMLQIPRGTIRATVLIETLPAAFQMDEIIYQLRQHSSGLNCGRWDYLFSYIKTLQNQSDAYVLPDRKQVNMSVGFMSSYVKLLIQTCHQRGVHAMGGMAAQIPIKNDPVANDEAMKFVAWDKKREFDAGHDGTWIAHPALGKIAGAVFNQLSTPNQLHYIPKYEHPITQHDLLNPFVAKGRITRPGVAVNIESAVEYLGFWLAGSGCVPINNLMEDAATAEVSRSQVYQWVKAGAITDDTHEAINSEMTGGMLDEAVLKLSSKYAKQAQYFKRAGELLLPNFNGSTYDEFITTLGYDDLVKYDARAKF